MAFSVKDNGAWTPVKEVYVNQAGEWVEAKEVYLKSNGEWVKVHESAPAPGITSL